MRLYGKGASLCLQMKELIRSMAPGLSMTSPAIYRIRVRGALDAHLVRQLDGINLSEQSDSDEIPTAVLVGRLADQAALSGLLNALYELHLPLISLECLDAEAKKDMLPNQS
jgi:hypothetical protein